MIWRARWLFRNESVSLILHIGIWCVCLFVFLFLTLVLIVALNLQWILWLLSPFLSPVVSRVWCVLLLPMSSLTQFWPQCRADAQFTWMNTQLTDFLMLANSTAPANERLLVAESWSATDCSCCYGMQDLRLKGSETHVKSWFCFFIVLMKCCTSVDPTAFYQYGIVSFSYSSGSQKSDSPGFWASNTWAVTDGFGRSLNYHQLL